MKAYDLLVQAESGLAMVTGHPAGPGRVGVSVCDIACGMSAHAAVLEALIERSRTGRGTGLKISLFDAIADWMNVPLLQFEGSGQAPGRVGLAHPTICPYGAFSASRMARRCSSPSRTSASGHNSAVIFYKMRICRRAGDSIPMSRESRIVQPWKRELRRHSHSSVVMK